MTVNELITMLRQLSWKLSSGDIPITINHQSVDITDVTLEGDAGTYWCNINLQAKPFDYKNITINCQDWAENKDMEDEK